MQRKNQGKKLLIGAEVLLVIISAAAGIKLDLLSLSMLALAGLYDILYGFSNRLKDFSSPLKLTCNIFIYILSVSGVLLLLSGVSIHLLNPAVKSLNAHMPLAICLAWFLWSFLNDSKNVFSLNGKMIYWGIPFALMLMFALRASHCIILGDSLFTIGIAVNLLRKCYYQTVQEAIPF